ncbi:MAG: hypothetical protein KBF73_11535 [Flavobacteriales bacterium]|nr:hypothetical protein [Flavobacteriales bacterium]
MKTAKTNNKQEERDNFWHYAGVVIAIILMSLTLQTVYAQNGKLKLKGDIVNVNEDDTRSLITLFSIHPNSTEAYILGQFIVEGNDWFKTHLQFDNKYTVEIAATNGLTKRFYFDTKVPADLQGSKLKLDLEFDMGWQGNIWPVVNAGKVAYDWTDSDFSYIDLIDNNSVAISSRKP